MRTRPNVPPISLISVAQSNGTTLKTGFIIITPTAEPADARTPNITPIIMSFRVTVLFFLSIVATSTAVIMVAAPTIWIRVSVSSRKIIDIPMIKGLYMHTTIPVRPAPSLFRLANSKVSPIAIPTKPLRKRRRYIVTGSVWERDSPKSNIVGTNNSIASRFLKVLSARGCTFSPLLRKNTTARPQSIALNNESASPR